MKNIYIIGVPRTGKSTLCKLIKIKYPELNIISFEAVRNGFVKSLPDLNMGNRNSESRKNILPQFLIEFSHWNNIISNYGSIIEGSFTDVETIVNLINDNDIVICLGFNKRNLEEIVNEIKKHDTKDDYTKNWAEERIKKHFYDICEKDKENYDYCKKYNINYYDTFINRQEVFLNILEYIEKNL